MKKSKWLAPFIATTIALSSLISIVPQHVVEAKITTKKPVYLPTWQGIKVDDLEFFPRKGYIRYSKEKGLEYYMRVYAGISSYVTGFRAIDMKPKRAAMVPKMFKSLHSNQFRIQNRTLIFKMDEAMIFNMRIGEKGMLPNHIDAEVYELRVNSHDSAKEEYNLRCNFAGLHLEHDAITRYLNMGRLDYAEQIWKGYEKVYTPDYKAQQEESLSRMLNVLSDMEGFNREERTKFKEIVLNHSRRFVDERGKLYVADFTFKDHKYLIEADAKSLQFKLIKF